MQLALDALQWYVDEDEVIESMKGNEYWVEGKDRAKVAIEALRAAIAKPSESVLASLPKYWELVDALVGLACQRLTGINGELDTSSASGDEGAIDALTALGLVEDNKLISEAFNYEWLQERFGDCGRP